MAKQIKIFGPTASDQVSPQDRTAFEQLTKRWREDQGLQQEYGHIYAFYGAHGVDVPEHLMSPPAARPDVEGYIAGVKENSFSTELTEAEKARVHAYAATWQTHAEIRAEFRSFKSYASFMRFKEAGRIRGG